MVSIQCLIMKLHVVLAVFTICGGKDTLPEDVPSITLGSQYPINASIEGGAGHNDSMDSAQKALHDLHIDQSRNDAGTITGCLKSVCWLVTSMTDYVRYKLVEGSSTILDMNIEKNNIPKGCSKLSTQPQSRKIIMCLKWTSARWIDSDLVGCLTAEISYSHIEPRFVHVDCLCAGNCTMLGITLE